MHKIVVQGGQRLTGSVKASGAKNAVLPLLVAALLSSRGECILDEVPNLSDVQNMCALLSGLGVKAEQVGANKVLLNAQHVQSTEAPFELVRKMRASFLVLGPLLARFGQARVARPGGCSIGERPIDLHLQGFEAMGAKIEVGDGFIAARAEHGKLHGANISLHFASVGATQNLMMAAVLAEGTTVLTGAAREPEIVDLANLLNKMGADVRGAGTDVLTITGVRELTGVHHTVIPDRIEAGTFLIAAAISRGDVYVEGALQQDLLPLVDKLREAGATVLPDANGMRVKVQRALRPLDVKTWVHPGFPTDLQAQMMALLTVANGTSYITESVFENRFMHADELQRMGADIRIEGRTAIIKGVKQLRAARVTSTDLRAGAALLLAGMVAEGDTEVYGLHHIDRGYVDIEAKFLGLGANLRRVPIESLEEEATLL